MPVLLIAGVWAGRLTGRPETVKLLPMFIGLDYGTGRRGRNANKNPARDTT